MRVFFALAFRACFSRLKSTASKPAQPGITAWISLQVTSDRREVHSVKVERKNGNFIITVPALPEPRESSTGKSLLFATANGMVAIGDKAFRINVNVSQPR